MSAKPRYGEASCSVDVCTEGDNYFPLLLKNLQLTIGKIAF